MLLRDQIYIRAFIDEQLDHGRSFFAFIAESSRLTKYFETKGTVLPYYGMR